MSTRKKVSVSGRDRIRTAAIEVLRRADMHDFSLESVAKRAGVTRMTVYNQFGSRAGLFEDVFDDLIERGAFQQMPAVFGDPDPVHALDEFVAILGRFYTENRIVLAKLTASAGLDPDLDAAMASRHKRRRGSITAILERVGTTHAVVKGDDLFRTADVILNFATFSALAGPDQTPEAAVPMVRKLIRNLLGISVKPKARRAGRKAG